MNPSLAVHAIDVQMKHAFALVLLVVLVGCVPKKKHEALAKQLADTQAAQQAEIDARGEKIAGLEQSLAGEKARAADLEKQIETLKTDLELARAERDAFQAELAGMVKDKTQLAASVEEMKRALAELSKRKEESDKRVAEFRGLLDKFKALIDAGKLRVKIVDGRMVVELASDVLFASGSATLSKEGTASLEEIARALAAIPGRKFQVEGHTDDVPIKTAQYPSNWELASARAITVVRTMTDAGMPASRISGAAFADTKPARKNDSPEGRKANRRIEIVLVPDLNSLPGFDELNRIAKP